MPRARRGHPPVSSRRRRFPRGIVALILGTALALAARPALAHVTGPGGGFPSGFVHPLTGLDHFLAMFAVGV